jgi:hypothetical protein
MSEFNNTFPKEFQRNIWQELDKRFWGIFIISFILVNAMVFYMQSLPFVPAIETKKFLKQLYRTEKITTEVKVTDLTQLKEQREEAKEEAAVEAKIEEKRAERAKLTDEQRAAMRSARRAERGEKTAGVAQAVSQMSVFSAAGARRGGGGGGGGGLGKGTGPGGGGGGGGVGKFAGIVGDGVGIATGGVSIGGGKKLVSGGAIKEVAGDIKIKDVGTAGIEAGELGGGLEMEEVEEVKGAGAENILRKPETLNNIIKGQYESISRCFERYKKRDPKLNGRVMISLTILPNGIVDRISIQSQWSNPALGAEVDDCIRSRIERWRFDPIEKGDVKIEVPMSFY